MMRRVRKGDFLRFKTLAEMERHYYGGADSIIAKTDADITSADTAWFNPIYGRKVWSFLNYEKNAFAVLPKRAWSTSGWRWETASATTITMPTDGTEVAGGIAESGAMPDTVEPTLIEASTQPKQIVHGFGVTELQEFLSSVDDGVDVLPYMREHLGKSHAASINTMIMQNVEPIASNATANWAGTNNFESLDRLIASDAEEDAKGNTWTTNYDCWVGRGTATVDRDSGTTYDATVITGSGSHGTDGDLTLAKMNETLRTIWNSTSENPDVIITGAQSVTSLSELLEAERRFLEAARIVPQYGGARGIAPGVEAGFMVATYFGTPIIPTHQIATDTIPRIYFLNTNYVEYRAAKPTRYYETPMGGVGFVALNSTDVEGYYETMGEIIMTRFNAQGKLTDLK